MSVKTTFAKDFDYRTDRGAIVAYTAGWSGIIPQAHHDAASVAGVLAKEPAGKGNGS